MFELASEYEECVLLQTWTEIPTVNVRNGMSEVGVKMLSLYPCFFLSTALALFCVLATECPSFTAHRRSSPCVRLEHSVSQSGSQPAPC